MSSERPLVRWQPVQPMPGGMLDVTWTLDAARWPMHAAAAMVLELSEERSVSSGASRIAWSARVPVRVEDDGDGGWSLRACFELPTAGLPSAQTLGEEQARWSLTLTDASRAKRWRQNLTVATPPGWEPAWPAPAGAAAFASASAAGSVSASVSGSTSALNAAQALPSDVAAPPVPLTAWQPLGGKRQPDALVCHPLGWWRRALALLWLVPLAAGLWRAQLAFASEESSALPWTLAWLLLAAGAWAALLQGLSRQWLVAMQDGWVMCWRGGALWRSRRAVPAFELRGLTLAPRLGRVSVQAEPRRGRAWPLTPSMAPAAVAEAVAARWLRAWRLTCAQTPAEHAPWPELQARRQAAQRRQGGLRPGVWQLLCGVGVLAAGVSVVPNGWQQPQQVLEAWSEHVERLSAPSHQRVALRLALRHASTQDLADLLAQGTSPNVRLERGDTPLIRAARRGRLDQVELLLRYGAQVDLADNWSTSQGETPLLVALLYGHEAVARRLSRAGARWTQSNRLGWTPMHMAAQSDNLECLQMAQAAGVPLNSPALASQGETPAMLAAQKGKLKALAWLVDQGVDLRQRDAQGQSVLDWAVRGEQTAVQAWIRERLAVPVNE
jgi:hypothetical protein